MQTVYQVKPFYRVEHLPAALQQLNQVGFIIESNDANQFAALFGLHQIIDLSYSFILQHVLSFPKYTIGSVLIFTKDDYAICNHTKAFIQSNHLPIVIMDTVAVQYLIVFLHRYSSSLIFTYQHQLILIGCELHQIQLLVVQDQILLIYLMVMCQIMYVQDSSLFLLFYYAQKLHVLCVFYPVYISILDVGYGYMPSLLYFEAQAINGVIYEHYFMLNGKENSAFGIQYVEVMCFSCEDDYLLLFLDIPIQTLFIINSVILYKLKPAIELPESITPLLVHHQQNIIDFLILGGKHFYFGYLAMKMVGGVMSESSESELIEGEGVCVGGCEQCA